MLDATKNIMLQHLTDTLTDQQILDMAAIAGYWSMCVVPVALHSRYWLIEDILKFGQRRFGHD